MEAEAEQEVQTPPGDPKYKLWQSLNASKFYTKSYDEFDKQFSNQESVGKLFSALSENKYYTKPLTDFQNQFFTPEKKSPDQTSLPDYITPHPSNSDAGTSLLAHGAADLDSIAKGQIPLAEQASKPPVKTEDTPGFRVIDPTELPAVKTDKTDANFKEAQKEANAIDPGTYDPQSIWGQVDVGIAKFLDIGAGLGKLEDSITDLVSPKIKNYNIANTGKLFDWASNYLTDYAAAHPLPNTFTGSVVGGTGRIVPTIIGASVTGGASEAPLMAEIGDAAGGYLTKSNIVQNALTKAAGPLTQYLTVSGAGEGLKKGSDESGGKLLPTVLGGLKGAQEGLESGITLEAQMAAGGQIGSNLFKLALKSGVVNEDGVITEQALKSLVGSPFAFAASSVADDVANGRPINWENAGISGVSALPFEAQHVFTAVGDAETIKTNKQQLDQHINDAIATANSNSIVNFTTATPEDIVNTMNRPESSQELQVQSLAQGVKAQDAETLKEKNAYHLAQLELQKQADIKSIGETIVQHGVDPFTNAVNGTELPDDIKSTLISKAHGINQEFNPVIKEQADTQQTVADLTDKIDHLQSIPGATDPVNNPAGVNDLIDMVEKRTDAQVKLLDDATNNPLQVPNRQIFYHGSADDFDNFSPEHLGLFTNSESAKNGYFFTDSPDVANTYKNAGVINRPNIEGLKDHLESLSENELKSLHKDILGKYGYTFDPEDPKEAIDELIDDAKEDHGRHIYDKNFATDKIAKHDTNTNRGYKAYETKGTLHQVHLDEQNPLIVDGNGEHPGGLDINNIIKQAKADGHDSVIIKNIHDEAAIHEKGAQYEPSTIHIVFDHNQIKKLTADEQAQKESESEKPTGVAATPEPKPNLEGGFQLKSKDFGQVTIIPRADGDFDVHPEEGGVTRATKADIADPDYLNFNTDKIGAPENVQILHGTENPNEIARLYDEKVRELQDTGSKEGAIAAYGPSATADGFSNVNDRNNITDQIKRNYFKNKNGIELSLDQQADELNRQYFNGTDVVHPNDLAEFMIKYPGGRNSFYTTKGNPELREISDRYKELTGNDLTNGVARKLAVKYTDVTANEIREIERNNAGKDVVEKIKSFIKDQLDKPGLHGKDEVANELEKEFERYLADPNNEFNLFYDEFKGDLLDESEQQQAREAIARAKDEQLTNGANDTGTENGIGSNAPGPEAQVPESERKPTKVEIEYDQQITDKKAEVKDFEKQIENKLADMSKKNDLFESTGTKKGEEAQQDIFDKTATNTEPDNIKNILEPIRAKLETAKRELADLEDNRDAVFEQARQQYQMELDDIPFQRGEGTNIPPERAEAIQGLMKKVFPNVETNFHPTVDSFAEAAKANGIDAKDLPNAFVDKTGTIHFNPEALHADTQIHEYGHILTQWAKANAPALYKRMVSFGRDAADIKAELKERGYKISGSQLNEEAFVTMLGRHGEGKLDEVIKNSGTRGTVSKFINDLWTKFQRYLIDKTGFDISKFRNIKNMPINEFLDTVNSKYLLSDTKVSDIGTKEYSQVDQQRPERPMRDEGESMADYMKRVIDWTREQTTGQKTADFTEDVNKEPDSFTLEQDKLKPGYNFSETSIKNRVVAEERRARFLDEVESSNKRDFGTVWDSGKKMIDNREIDPAVFTENLIKNPRPLMPEETAALTYDRMRLYNDHQTTMDQINDAMEANNTTTETEARVRLAYIEDRIEKNDIAAKQAGYEQGLGLAARRMISAQDYSLANQIQMAKVANGGKELPEDVRLKLESLSKQLQDAQKRLAEYESNASAKATAISLARLKKEAELEQRTERKQKRSQSQEQIKKNIESIKSTIFDKLTKNKGLSSSILPYADKLAEITPDLAKLAKEYIKSGIVSIEGIVDAVHADIKDHLEGITKRDVRDALSGYGKTNKPTKETIEAQLRELKSQMRLTSALEDAQNGERPLKSGYVHESPSEEVRNLQKQVHDAMRANGIEVERTPISEEDAWKSALDSTKTRLKNQIDDLNKQLETGIKPDKKNSVILDQEAQDLKAERDRLKAAVEETENNKELTDEERVKILTKSTEKSIEEYQKRIDDLINPKDEQDQPKKTSVEDLVNKTPELKALRDRLAELKDIHSQLKDESKPKLSPEEVALYAYKKRMAKKMADLQDAIDSGDYAKAPAKEPLVLDSDAKRMQSEVFKLQRKFDEAREKIRLANRTKLEKRLDWASKYRRFVLLANLTTVAKLTAAGATRLVTSPLEEVAGHGLSLIPGLDKVSQKAPREGGGLNIQAEADSLAQVLSKRSIQEMYRTVKEGRSELDERVDDKDRTFKENSIFELPGRIHAALKTVPKQVEYYRSLNKRIAWALRNGYDITSPDIQTSIQMEAFKDQNPELFTGKTVAMSELEKQAFNDGKRAIFMQDNFLSDEFQAMVKRWETRGPKGELAATIARIFLPIIKIPTNFVAETSSLAFGGVKAVIALSKGIDQLTPEDADYVMRALKKQSIGAAFFALGYLLPNNVGGFYRQGEKRKKDGPQADDLVIFGEKVPHWLMHAPVFEVMQMGATVRNVHDQYEKDRSKSGMDEAITSSLSAGKGLFGQVPFFGEPAELTRGLENEESLKKFSANFVLGLAVPYDVQRVAKWMDEDSHGNVIPRKEKGFIQHVEGGVPFLRENLKKK